MKQKKVEKVVRKYADLVYRVAFSMLRNKDDAEDIFQDVFIKLCTENVKFLSKEHEKAWIIRVTKNKCLDFLKKSCNKTKAELNDNIKVEEKEDDSDVIKHVQSLPEKYRIVIYLFYYEGYKISEMSKILDINESTLKSQLVKARELLKEKIGEEF
ncbi:MAG: sigma-70 family RNA polymerase sigma factor [Clostridia bacterium]|nr:sigma-70 family RNA polymerase sigma factor [Clostridia bacterium]